MKKTKKLIVANWKMNPVTLDEAKQILIKIRKIASELKKTTTVVCPPFLFLSELSKLLKGKEFFTGAQNCHWENSGSYTGEVSSMMVKNAGGNYVIIGHSERRKMGETDENISKKVQSAIKEGLKSIICVGEAERDANGIYFAFIKNQIALALAKVQRKDLDNIVIAYEPVWAIGKSEAMQTVDVHEMSIFIRKVLNDIFSKDYIQNIPVLYGGSVTSLNCQDILANGGIEGLLIGRDSLNPDNFCETLRVADKI